MGKVYEGPALHVPPSQQSAQGPVPKPGEPVEPQEKKLQPQTPKAEPEDLAEIETTEDKPVWPKI